MSNEHQDTPRDVEPLNVYLGAYLRKWMGKPPSWEAEKIIGQILKYQLMGLFRAAFITGALALLAFSGQEQLKPFYHWLGDKWAVGKSYWALAACVGLLVASVFLPRIAAACQRLRRWAENRRYLPFWTLLAVVGLLVSGFYQSPFWGTVYGLALLSLLFVQLRAPIVSRHDTKDSFQRSYFVERLMEHFLKPETRLRRIGVFGTWGSGKTTVLKLLREALAASPSKKFRVAWVNPWTAKTPEEALTLIAQGFDEALGSSPLSFLSWSWLGAIKTSFDGGLSLDLHRLINGGVTDTEAKLIARINARMKAMNFTVVLLVDDMERAECDVIRRIFPLIDRLGAIEQGFFVFAVDPDRVAKAFKESSSGEEETKGYLDKVFDLQITLPDLRPKDIEAWGKERINAQETPKLYAAWDKLKDVIPTNPREALHFINDAITKEVLFLSRLADDEQGRDFAQFFLFRMLQMTIPTISDALSNEEIFSYYQNKLSMDIYEKSDDAELKAWEVLSSKIEIPKSKEQYSRKLFIYFLKFSTRIDLDWLFNEHMRLLTPSRNELDRINDRWANYVGQESMLTTIKMACPNRSFSDIEIILTDIIDATISKYKSLRTLYSSRSNSQRSKAIIRQKALSYLECLTKQFVYGYNNSKQTLDIKCFSPGHFKKWLEMLCENNLNEVLDAADLVTQEYHFHTLLSGLLPLEEKFHFASQSIEDLDNEGDYFNALEDHREHLVRLQKYMESQVLNEFIVRMEDGKLHDADSFYRLGIGSLRDVFMDPDFWLSEENELSVIAGFPERAAKSPHFATATAAITEAIFEKVKARLLDYHKDPSKKTPIRSITLRPAYFQHFWKAAHRAPDQVEALHRLRQEAEEILNQHLKKSEDPILTAEQFEAAFPVMPSVLH